jgi:hypothetical protein
MPTLVQLITETGEQVAAVNDVHDFIARCASENGGWRLLKYVDRDGDTYFNKLQIPDFLSDWEAARVRSPENEKYGMRSEDLLGSVGSKSACTSGLSATDQREGRRAGPVFPSAP